MKKTTFVLHDLGVEFEVPGTFDVQKSAKIQQAARDAVKMARGEVASHPNVGPGLLSWIIQEKAAAICRWYMEGYAERQAAIDASAAVGEIAKAVDSLGEREVASRVVEIPDYSESILELARGVVALASREIPAPVVINQVTPPKAPKSKPVNRTTVIRERDDQGRPSKIETRES